MEEEEEVVAAGGITEASDSAALSLSLSRSFSRSLSPFAFRLRSFVPCVIADCASE